MIHGQAGAVAQLDGAYAAFGDNGVHLGLFEQIAQGFAHGPGQLRAEGAGFHAECAAHAAAGAGLDEFDFCAASAEPVQRCVAPVERSLVA